MKGYTIVDMFTGEERPVNWFVKRFHKTRAKIRGLENQKNNDKPLKTDFENVDDWHDALTEHARFTKCVCNHPSFQGGVCNYRTCYHDTEHHK